MIGAGTSLMKAAVPEPEGSRNRILVIIDQEQGFQNFVGAGAFEALARQHDVEFASPPQSYRTIRVDPLSYVESERWHALDVDTARAAAWHNLALLNQVRPSLSRHGRRLRWLRLSKIQPWWRRQLLAVLALPGLRSAYGSVLLRRLLAGRNASLAALLDGWRPDIVLHPSALNGALINDLLIACRERAIPAVVMMNSWDNPSSKNATYVQPDWLLVWGEQTRRHAIDFMGMPPGKVVPLGAPQLEVLRHVDTASSRQAFRSALGLKADDSVVLYAASTRSADFESLVALDSAIEGGRLPSVRVLYRPYPTDKPRQDWLRIGAHGWRHVTIMNGEWMAAGGTTQQTIGSQRFVQEKIAALAGADAVISPLSTILLEAAILGRPVLGYYAGAQALFRRAHFDDFLAIPDVVSVDRASRLVPGVAQVLRQAGDAALARRLQAATRRFITESATPYPDRLAAFVAGLISERAALRNVGGP